MRRRIDPLKTIIFIILFLFSFIYWIFVGATAEIPFYIAVLLFWIFLDIFFPKTADKIYYFFHRCSLKKVIIYGSLILIIISLVLLIVFLTVINNLF